MKFVEVVAQCSAWALLLAVNLAEADLRKPSCFSVELVASAVLIWPHVLAL